MEAAQGQQWHITKQNQSNNDNPETVEGQGRQETRWRNETRASTWVGWSYILTATGATQGATKTGNKKAR